DRSAVASLVARLSREKDREARAAAVTALGQLGDQSAVEPLIGRLADRDAFVRREAARALGLLHARPAIGALVDRLGRDEEGEVRRQAAHALGLIGDASARPALEAALHDKDPYVGDEAHE